MRRWHTVPIEADRADRGRKGLQPGERRTPGRKHRLSCCLASPQSLDDRSRFRLSPTYHRLSLDRGYPRHGVFGWVLLKLLHQKPHASPPFRRKGTCDARTYHIPPDKPVSIDVRFASRRLIGRAEGSRPEGDAVKAAI